MTNFFGLARTLLGSIVCASLLGACGNGNNDDLDDRTGLAAPRARFVHAATGGPAVTLYRNGNPEKDAGNVDYKFASQYYDVSTGQNNFALRAGTNGIELGTINVNATRGHKYTVVALLTSSVVDLITVDDPYNKSLVNDNARVRVINAAVNAQNIDIYLTPSGVNFNAVVPTMSSVGYKGVNPPTGANSIEVEAGAYQLRVTAAGSKTAIFSSVVALAKNVDWLVVLIPDKVSSILDPNNIRALVVRSDDTSDATDELTTN